MDKKDIKELLRESGKTPHLTHAVKTKSADDDQVNGHDKVAQLLGNDIINHAGIVRQLKGDPWAGNDEATNRSLFRKKLNKLKDDGGGEYTFSEETLSDIQKIMMNLSSTINHSIGRQGK